MGETYRSADQVRAKASCDPDGDGNYELRVESSFNGDERVWVRHFTSKREMNICLEDILATATTPTTSPSPPCSTLASRFMGITQTVVESAPMVVLRIADKFVNVVHRHATARGEEKSRNSGTIPEREQLITVTKYPHGVDVALDDAAPSMANTDTQPITIPVQEMVSRDEVQKMSKNSMKGEQ